MNSASLESKITHRTVKCKGSFPLKQGEFILTRKVNDIDLLQINLDNGLPMRYKESLSYASSGGNYLEPAGDSCPARSSIRRTALSATHAGASLPGFFAQDQRDALVRGHLVQSMGSPSELFRLGVEVRCTGS